MRTRDKKLPVVKDEDLQMVAVMMPTSAFLLRVALLIPDNAAMGGIEGLKPGLIKASGPLSICAIADSRPMEPDG